MSRRIDLSIKDNLKNTKIFFGEHSGLQRFDYYHYPRMKELEQIMRAAFWNPEEISMTKDTQNYLTLPLWVQAIFESNISYQTEMDTQQSQGIEGVFSQFVSSPAAEALLKTHGYFELIHSLSYAHNLISVTPNPTRIYNMIQENEHIKHRIDKEVEMYDKIHSLLTTYEEDLKSIQMKADMSDISGKIMKGVINAIRKVFKTNFNKKKYIERAKKIILEAMIRINALEGLKFYVSFLITYKINDEFGNKIPGATKIIKLINYDEDLHTVVFSFLINTLKTQKHEGFMHLFEKGENGEPSFFEAKAYEVYKEVFEDEKAWGEYLLSFCEARRIDKDGKEIVKVFNIKDPKDVLIYSQEDDNGEQIWDISGPNTIPGLTIEVLEHFMKYYTNVRLNDIGLSPMFEGITSNNIITWFKKYKRLNDEKTAAQETEILAYSIGQLINDVEEGEFSTNFFNLSDFEN